MKNKGWALVSIVVLLGLLMGTLACAASTPRPTPTPKVTPRPTPTPIQKVTPRPTPAPSPLHITADGSLFFTEDRRLNFGLISGRVSQVNVSELDKVTKGQVLAKLDTTSQERAIKAAEIAVDAAKLTVNLAEGERKQAENRVKSAEADVQLAQDNIKSAQIGLDLATDDFRKITYPYTYSTFAFDVPQAVNFISEAKRQMNDAAQRLQAGLTADQSAQVSRQLQDALDNLARGNELLARGQGTDVFQSGALNTKDFWTLRAAQLQMDKAQLAIGDAQGVVNKTALALDSARSALNNAQLAVDKNNKDVDRAMNDLARARDELDKAAITAPFDGVIAKVEVKEGAFLSDTSTVAIEILVPTRMGLVVNVDELDILNIKAGQGVTITVYALPDKQFLGVVTSISPLSAKGADGEVSYEVKTVFDVPESLALKAGMSGAADIAM